MDNDRMIQEYKEMKSLDPLPQAEQFCVVIQSPELQVGTGSARC